MQRARPRNAAKKESVVKKSDIFALVVAATLAVGVSGNSATASVIYTLVGTDINQFGGGSHFSFVYTSPTFITASSLVNLDSCTTGNAAFDCSQAQFTPAVDFGAFGVHDKIDFLYVNHDHSGSGSGQLLFALGAFGTPGTYPVGPISMSSDAVLTVSQTPLPAAFPLFAAGFGVMGLLARRRKQKAPAAGAAA
jgi:hypothetical protein